MGGGGSGGPGALLGRASGPRPTPRHPADLKEPLFLLRAIMAAGLARLGIQVLGSCHSAPLPSCHPLRGSPYPPIATQEPPTSRGGVSDLPPSPSRLRHAHQQAAPNNGLFKLSTDQAVLAGAWYSRPTASYSIKLLESVTCEPLGQRQPRAPVDAPHFSSLWCLS